MKSCAPVVGIRRNRIVLLFASLGFLVPGCTTMAQSPTESELSDFVSSPWHGMRYQRALDFRDLHEAPDLLRDWLKDPARADDWTNIALVLGVLGDDTDVPRFERLILKGGGEGFKAPLLDQRGAALQALALLAYETEKRTGGGESAAYQSLLGFAQKDALVDRGVEWPGFNESEKRAFLTSRLDRLALQMLSLTIHDRTRETFRRRSVDLDDEAFVNALFAANDTVVKANGDLLKVFERQLAEGQR